MLYKDRTDAGKALADELSDYRKEDPVVMALPNGGIPVGLEISKGLECYFDLLFVSKITPAFNTEIGYGSVSESGVVNLNRSLIGRFGLSENEVSRDIDKTKMKINSRIKCYSLNKRHSIKNKPVILVDDGIASGYTMINSVETMKKKGAETVVIAVPTAPLSSINNIQHLVNKIICPDIRDTFHFAVADAYENWYDLNNDEAIEFLKKYGYA